MNHKQLRSTAELGHVINLTCSAVRNPNPTPLDLSLHIHIHMPSAGTQQPKTSKPIKGDTEDKNEKKKSGESVFSILRSKPY